MASRSFDDWANELAEKIAAKNPPKPKSLGEETSGPENVTDSSSVALYVNELYKKNPQDARNFLASIISNSNIYLRTVCKEPEGINFWDKIHKMLKSGSTNV